LEVEHKSNVPTTYIICIYTIYIFRVNVLLGLKFNIFIRSYFQFEIKSSKKKTIANVQKLCAKKNNSV